MSYTLIYSEQSLRQLKKLDKAVSTRIRKYLRKIESLEEPRYRGKALSQNLRGFWRYRVGNYRILCEIDDNKLIIVAIDIEHRKKIYKK